MAEILAAGPHKALATRLRDQGLDADRFIAWADRVARHLGIETTTLLRRHEPCRDHISFADYLSFLEWNDPDVLRPLFLDAGDRLEQILKIRQSVPVWDVSEIFKVLDADAPQQHYFLLYQKHLLLPRVPYTELVERARLVAWSDPWLDAWCKAEMQGADPVSVKRLVARGFQADAETYIAHSLIESHVRDHATPDEVRRARALGRKPRIAGWAIRCVRVLVKHGITEADAWKRAAILVRTQNEKTRARLLVNPDYEIERLRARQPDVYSELMKPEPATREGTGPITETVRRVVLPLPPKIQKMDPTWANNVKTVHLLLNIAPHLPPDVDLEHAQAIIVHGHLNPGQKEMFSGGRYHDIEDIPTNVRNKLGNRWNPGAFENAYAFLTKVEVLDHKKRDTTGMLTPLSQIVNPVGRAIAQAWHAFARQYKPNNRRS